MKIFITGATGFVGGHLVKDLSGNHDVHVLPHGCDLRQPLEPAVIPADIDVVIHAAAVISGASEPAEYSDTNVRGTLHVANAAVAAGAARFILLSTGGLYRPAGTPRTEDAAIEPRGDYAVSKWESEQAVRALRSAMRVQILRLFFPYGPGQRKERLVPRLIERVRTGEAITLANGEGPLLNPIYIDDLVEWIERILAIDDDLLLNLGGPETTTLRAIVETIGAIAGVAPNIATTEGPADSWISDNTRATRLTGYAPVVTVDEGLRRTLSTIS
jgi:nucleoside-diphosphate-sugar epimerase